MLKKGNSATQENIAANQMHAANGWLVETIKAAGVSEENSQLVVSVSDRWTGAQVYSLVSNSLLRSWGDLHADLKRLRSLLLSLKHFCLNAQNW